MKSRINFSVLMGIGAAGMVLWYGVLAGTVRKEIFWDPHALILVLGGTFAAAFIAFPASQFRDLWTFFTSGALFPTDKAHMRTIEHIMGLAHRPDPAQIDPTIRLQFHPYLLEGYTLMRKQDWDPLEYRAILLNRNQRFKERYSLDAKALTALAKFPPAFGLLGATTGMIAMMSGLGPGGKDSIGPAMAVALVATFWGIAVANFVLLPLADHANRLNGEDARLRLMIATGLTLIQQGTRPAALYEHMIGFLPVFDRISPNLKLALQLADNHYKKQEAARITGAAS
jgi:chemotaxis protein MotA